MAAMEGDAPATTVHIAGIELPDEDVTFKEPAPARTSLIVRLLYLVAGMFLFVTALGLMKAGAQALVPTLTGSIFTDNAWSTLGLGWLGACIVLSGSPIAASALTLLDGGAIDQLLSFTMLTGSRLGAAFVVLVAGTVYALRHKGAGSRRAPISIGILSLLVTMVVYVPGALVGFLLLDRGVFDNLTIGTSPGLTSATDTCSAGRSTSCRSSCLVGRCSRSAWSCCWRASLCSTRCCRPSALRSSSTATRRGTRASGPCSCSGAACAC